MRGVSSFLGAEEGRFLAVGEEEDALVGFTTAPEGFLTACAAEAWNRRASGTDGRGSKEV